MFEPEEVKQDFLILEREVNGKPLVYLDSAATSQKPQAVIDAISEYYRKHNSNVHRGAHTLGDESTEMLEEARQAVADFIGVSDSREIIFVRNTTEAINLVAYSWGMKNLKKGDVVVISDMAHHSNMVPWQEVAKHVGAEIRYVAITDDGWLDMTDFRSKVKGAKLVAISHVSNALGTINSVEEIVRLGHKEGAVVVIDGAQAVSHMSVDVSSLKCDFYAFSGHKMLGPMGIGILWGKRELFEEMDPFMTGGGMIKEVKREGSSWTELPEKFEAGTLNVAGAWGLKAAISYLKDLGMQSVRAHDKEIVEYALGKLLEFPGVRVLGSRNSDSRSGSVSFVYNGVHAHDVATILDSFGVAVRSGHHCAMILHDRMKIPASVRVSFNVYTTKEDIDKLIKALSNVGKVFQG